MQTIFRVAVLALAAAAVGCTYTANVVPTSLPAAEIIPGRELPYTISQYFAPGMENINQEPTQGFICSAHKYSVNIGPALVASIRTVNEAGFEGVIPSDEPRAAAPGVERHLSFESESFQARLDFVGGAFLVRAVASAEIVFRVTAYDGDGKEILRTMASGSSEADAGAAGCEGGEQALLEASRRAIQRAVEGYVHKVINAQRL